MFKLHNYFKDKFSVLESENDVILTAKQEVHDKYEELRNGVCNDKVMSETMITRYIQKLHSGSSPGMDGISAEHLKYALSSRIVNHLSVMLSQCIKYGVVPTSFTEGILVPLLKKTTLDPTDTKNYRPVTISSNISKILELYIL